MGGRRQCTTIATGWWIFALVIFNLIVVFQRVYTGNGLPPEHIIRPTFGIPFNRALQSVDTGCGDRHRLQTLNFEPETGFMDKYRKFAIHSFVSVGARWRDLADNNLCLSTHTTVDRLHWLVNMTERWSSSISLAVFVPDIEFSLAEVYVKFLKQCFPGIDNNVSFHFLYPVEYPPVTGSPGFSALLRSKASSFECHQHEEFLKDLMNTRPAGMMKWRNELVYPQNLHRNVARRGCPTLFTYTPDIDMIPCLNMAEQLEEFLSKPEQQDCQKCAYVIPTYEISKNSTGIADDKDQLLQLKKQHKAQRFHVHVYDINQKSSNLSRWENLPKSSELSIAYNVTKYIFKYEPLYVAKANIPEYDERFVGFGNTRNTQVYEMFVAGYKFMLLNNVFTNHWGFQTLRDRPPYRARQQERNNIEMEPFVREVTARYGSDPYGVLKQVKKTNWKNVKVSYGKPEKGKGKAKIS